jgi:hypothetical protein
LDVPADRLIKDPRLDPVEGGQVAIEHYFLTSNQQNVSLDPFEGDNGMFVAHAPPPFCRIPRRVTVSKVPTRRKG